MTGKKLNKNEDFLTTKIEWKKRFFIRQNQSKKESLTK